MIVEVRMTGKALGRGLSAFFDASDIVDDAPARRTNDNGRVVENIDIRLIEENPYQPRKIFSDEAVTSLAASIKEHGILQPLIVQEENGRYILIAGERRLRASKYLLLDKVPCIVNSEKYTKAKMLELAILENIQREDLDVLEEAEAYRRLSEEFGFTQEKIAETTGKSRSHIANMLRLNALPAGVKDLIHDKKLTFGHARALVGIQDAEEIAQKIVDEDLSVRQVEKMIRDKKLKFQKEVGVYEEQSDSEEIRHHISTMLNMNVKVKLKGTGGAIEIKFNDSAELDRFMQIINNKGANL